MFAGITTNNALPPHYHCPKCHHHEWTGNLKKDYTINDEIVTKTLKIGLDFDDKHCPSCGELMWSDGFSGDFRSFVGAELDKIPDCVIISCNYHSRLLWEHSGVSPILTAGKS